MKKYYFLIIATIILGLVLTGCSLLSNVGQVPVTEQSGISYLTKATESDPLETTLFAGQHIDVGTVSVWNGINEALGVECLYVKYEITLAGWCLIETHLAVATSLDGIPQTKKGNPIPGQFPYKHEDLDFATDDEYIIPLSEIDEEVECEDIFYIAAQASLQNLNNPEFVETVIVDAYSDDFNPLATCSIVILESGKMYLLEASEVANAGAKIDFDAKYSISGRFPLDTWTDLVTGYEIHGPDLLGLAVDGVFVDWGVYNPAHVYYWDMTGKGSCVALRIYDLPGSYGNNSGSLTVDIYLYQEESAWAGFVEVESEETQIPFDGKNWATYFEYEIENLLPTISSDDLAGSYLIDADIVFDVKTVNPLCGEEYERVIFKYTIWNTNLSDIKSFEYLDGTIYKPMPMVQYGSDVGGYFGPLPDCFTMPVSYSEETTFKIKFNTARVYNVAITLNDCNNGVLTTLNESVEVLVGP